MTLQCNWLSVLSCDECQSAFTMYFHTLHCEIYEECFPLITFHGCYKNRKKIANLCFKKFNKIQKQTIL